MYFNAILEVLLSVVVVMADTGAGPSQKRRKLNNEQLKGKRKVTTGDNVSHTRYGFQQITKETIRGS